MENLHEVSKFFFFFFFLKIKKTITKLSSNEFAQTELKVNTTDPIYKIQQVASYKKRPYTPIHFRVFPITYLLDLLIQWELLMIMINIKPTSRKHAYIILTLLKPTFI